MQADILAASQRLHDYIDDIRAVANAMDLLDVPFSVRPLVSFDLNQAALSLSKTLARLAPQIGAARAAREEGSRAQDQAGVAGVGGGEQQAVAPAGQDGGGRQAVAADGGGGDAAPPAGG